MLAPRTSPSQPPTSAERKRNARMVTGFEKQSIIIGSIFY